MICKFPTTDTDSNENSFVLNVIRKNENKQTKIEAALNKLNKGFLIEGNTNINKNNIDSNKKSKNKVTSDNSMLRINKLNQIMQENDRKLKYSNTSYNIHNN